VPLLATFSDHANLFMLSDVVRGGDLHQVFYCSNEFKRTLLGGIPECDAAFYMANALSMLDFLHERNIIYRNMRFENMLIGDDGYVRFCDMSMCKPLGSDSATTTTLCGCSEYLAPEMVLSQPYNRGVDYWMLGILLFELLTGSTPFDDTTLPGTFKNLLHAHDVLMKRLEEVNAMAEAHAMSSICLNILRSLLQDKSCMRLGLLRGGIGGIWKHTFFTTQLITKTSIRKHGLDAPYIPHFEAGADDQGVVVHFKDHGDEIDDLTFLDDTEEYSGPNADIFADF